MMGDFFFLCWVDSHLFFLDFGPYVQYLGSIHIILLYIYWFLFHKTWVFHGIQENTFGATTIPPTYSNLQSESKCVTLDSH